MSKTRTSEIATERLIIRPFHASDATAVQILCGDPTVARMTSRLPNPLPAGHTARWIAGHDALRANAREWPFCITKGGRPIGSIGLRRDAGDALALGYWIGAPYWHRGYATEATRAIANYGFDDLATETIHAGAYIDNDASTRVLEKCGFRYTHTDAQWCNARGAAVACRRYMKATR
jgi:RimJ/RimL family protein N-acetyltransferase